MQWCGPGARGEESLAQDPGAYRLGGALLYKEMLCSDISEQPQLAHGGGGQWRELVCGSLQRLVPPASRAAGSADRGAIVPCPLCAVQGVWGIGRVGSSRSFHRVQFNENRKIKGQDRRKKAPSMLMCRLGN